MMYNRDREEVLSPKQQKRENWYGVVIIGLIIFILYMYKTEKNDKIDFIQNAKSGLNDTVWHDDTTYIIKVKIEKKIYEPEERDPPESPY